MIVLDRFELVVLSVWIGIGIGGDGGGGGGPDLCGLQARVGVFGEVRAGGRPVEYDVGGADTESGYFAVGDELDGTVSVPSERGCR